MCKKLLRDSGSLNLSRKDRENVITEIASKYNGSLCLSSINVAAKHVYTYDTNGSCGIIKKCAIDNSSVLIEYLIVADKKNDKYYVLYNASASLIQEEIGSDNDDLSIANEKFNVLDINNEWTINSYSISFELAIKVDSLYVAADIIKNDMIGEEIRTLLDDLYSDIF